MTGVPIYSFFPFQNVVMATERSMFVRMLTPTCVTTAPFRSDAAARAPRTIQEDKASIVLFNAQANTPAESNKLSWGRLV